MKTQDLQHWRPKKLGGAIFIIMIGCAPLQPRGEPFFHTPFANSEWPKVERKPAPSRQPSRRATNRTGEAKDLRAKMISWAESLMSSQTAGTGYGTEDLERGFAAVNIHLNWRAEQGLDTLGVLARKRNAYRTDEDPNPGDIALFHNEWDANGNGENDDWLTGCGVVVSLDGPRFAVITRTSHASRRVIVWPDGPARRVIDGQLVNSFLRVPSRYDAPDTAYLAGQLYAGYIDLERLAGE